MRSLKENLGARIQEIRKKKKLTQETLAELIGLDIPNISNIERGKKFVSSGTLEKIIEALDVTPKELFDFHNLKTRDELIFLINQIVNNATDRELEYFYNMMSLYKEY